MLDPSRLVRRQRSRDENGDGLILAAISCPACLAANEREWRDGSEWRPSRVLAPSATVTRLRDRLTRSTRTEVAKLLADDETSSLLSTPELERDVREALGPNVRFRWNVAPYARY